MKRAPGRIGVISDTHGVINLDVLNALRGCQLILHAGDIGHAAIIDRLADDSGAEVIAIRGNNDSAGKWPLDDHDVLEGLDETAAIEIEGEIIAMEHGHRIWDTCHYHERLRQRHPGARLIVYGHTHIRVIDTEIYPWVVNPGAAGRERTKDGPSCLIIDTASPDWSIEELKFPKT